MPYASNKDRFDLIQSSLAFNACLFVVRVMKNGRESELVADDVDHALCIQKDWINRDVEYAEIFRVCEHDGSLIRTIGAYRKTDYFVGDAYQTDRDNREATC